MLIIAEGICYLGGLGYDPTETGEKEWGAGIPTVKVTGIEVSCVMNYYCENTEKMHKCPCLLLLLVRI